MRTLTLILLALPSLAAAQDAEPAPGDAEAAPVEAQAAPVDAEPAPVDAEPAPVDAEPAPVEGEVAAPAAEPVPTADEPTLPATQAAPPYGAPAKPPIWDDQSVRKGPPVEEPPELPPEARIEIAGELGATTYHDEHYDVFSNDDTLPVRGLRFGYRVVDRVVAQAAWSHGARGAQVFSGSDSSYNFEDDVAVFHSAYYADAFSLGAKVDVPLARRVVYPFVAARGQLVMQRIRLDDDLTDPASLGQRQSSAVAPGYELVAGFELRTPHLGRAAAQLAITLELGRAAVAEAEFESLGTLYSGGFLARTGIGVRF